MHALPQAIYLILAMLSLGYVIARHGESSGIYNAWATLTSTIVMILVLYFGDFFAPLGL